MAIFIIWMEQEEALRRKIGWEVSGKGLLKRDIMKDSKAELKMDEEDKDGKKKDAKDK